MWKKSLAAGIIGCLLFSACAVNRGAGNENTGSMDTGSMDTGNIDTGNTDAEDEMSTLETGSVYILNEIAVPDADLGDLLPEGGEKITLLESLAGENIYRLLEVYPNAGEGSYEEVNYYVQVLEPPYMEWTIYAFDMAESVKTVGAYVQDAYMEADGNIKMFIRGSDGNYIGSWNMEDGFSAKELSVDLQWDEIFGSMYTVWFDSEEEGLFFLNEEIILRYDENGEKQETALEQTGGLVLQIAESPFSKELYFCGADAESWSVAQYGLMLKNGGFTIWTADEKAPVYSVRDAASGKVEDNFFLNVNGDGSCVVFASETEGYLCNQMGVYRFSMEKQSHREIYDFANEYMRAHVRMAAMSVKEDGTLLILKVYDDGEYWFGEMQE